MEQRHLAITINRASRPLNELEKEDVSAILRRVLGEEEDGTAVPLDVAAFNSSI